MINETVKSYLPRWFFSLVYVVIGCLWLRLLGASLLTLLQPGVFFYAIPFAGECLFAMTLSAMLLYVCRRLDVHVAAYASEPTALFRKNPNPMWMYDLDTLRFLKVNDAAIALYGYSEQEFLSMRISDIRPEEDVPALINATEEIKLNLNNQYHWSGKWRHKKKSGQLIYVEISSHGLMFNYRRAELVLAYDITDKVQQEVKLQALNQELERRVMARTDDLLHLNRRLIDQNKIIKSANLQLVTISNELQDANSKIREHADLKSRFVSMASHEFRTPLANIKSNAWYIKKYYDKIDKTNVLERVQKIDKHIDYMTALLDDVLTIGKSDAVKLVANVESVNVHQFVNKVVNEVQTANGNTHQVHVYLCENVPEILDTDEKFLKNIFINLLNNAIRYSPLSAEVWLNIYRNGDEINFEVCDKGLGISPLEQEKIFEPFYRSDTTKDIQGTGLGLSIVKRAAELLNGKVSVDSEVGKGSTFTVTLLIRETGKLAVG